jgi:hypothetical protein
MRCGDDIFGGAVRGFCSREDLLVTEQPHTG